MAVVQNLRYKRSKGFVDAAPKEICQTVPKVGLEALDQDTNLWVSLAYIHLLLDLLHIEPPCL